MRSPRLAATPATLSPEARAMRDRLTNFDNANYASVLRMRVIRARNGLDGLDWLEDGLHENGNYMPSCVNCNRTFIGHKRRVVCKECATTTKPVWWFAIGRLVISLAKPRAERAHKAPFQSIAPERGTPTSSPTKEKP